MLVDKTAGSKARERILDAAEDLFMARGFAAVTLREICSELGLTHASLYYHFPGGKEALYAEVAERNIGRHGEGLAAALEAGGPRLEGRLKAAAAWLLSQPPMDLLRMARSDLTYLPEEEAGRIARLVYELVLSRLQAALEGARASGEIGPCDAGLMGGALVGMVESLHGIPDYALSRSREELAGELIDTLLKGLEYRKGGTP